MPPSPPPLLPPLLPSWLSTHGCYFPSSFITCSSPRYFPPYPFSPQEKALSPVKHSAYTLSKAILDCASSFPDQNCDVFLTIARLTALECVLTFLRIILLENVEKKPEFISTTQQLGQYRHKYKYVNNETKALEKIEIPIEHKVNPSHS